MNHEIETARLHFAAKLELEADAADVYEDLLNGVDIVVIDARKPDFYARGHIPGAINFPHRTMNATTTASLSKDKLYITYCDGLGCNASTRAALNLSELGFRVKEMPGGIDWWTRVDGYPLAIGDEPGTLRPAAVVCAC